MAINLTSPITGGAVSGLTTPGYGIVTDQAPALNGKQYAVTSTTGTQTNVETHSVSKPFTISFFRPANPRALPAVNPVSGVVKNIPVNTYKMIVRKGALPLLNQAAQVNSITITVNVAAGTDTYEPEDIKAMFSCAHGAFTQSLQGMVDAALTGTI